MLSWCRLGAPLARSSASSYLEAANKLHQVEAPHWQWAWSQSFTSTAQVGHLVMASVSQVHSQSVRSLGGGGRVVRLDHQPWRVGARRGPGRSLCCPGDLAAGSSAAQRGCTILAAARAVRSQGRALSDWLSACHCTMLLIVSLPHTTPLQKCLT